MPSLCPKHREVCKNLTESAQFVYPSSVLSNCVSLGASCVSLLDSVSLVWESVVLVWDSAVIVCVCRNDEMIAYIPV